MAVTISNTNKPLIPRSNDLSEKKYNRASLYSGKALDFDGVNDQITFGTISDLTFGTGDFSAVLDWQIDSVSSYSWAIAKKPALDFGIGINNTGGVLRLWIGGTLSLGTENILGSDWKKIAVVRESGVVSAYINGQSVSLTETAMAGSIDSGDLVVGSWTSNADYWNGLLNNIRIFNTALTAAQVSDLYLNPEKIVPDGVANSALKLWLPMMEGAGTTAYDGSGNGNHGTISGATWTSGIGAPVAQTALVGWNKGTNILGSTNILDGYWTKSGGSVTGGIEAPDGTNTAFKFERDGAFLGAIYWTTISGLSSTNYRYVYAKLPSGSASSSAQLLSHNSNTNNTFTITDEWQRFELNSAPNTAPSNFYIVDFRNNVGVDEIHLWAPQAAAGTDESVFVPTIGNTPQPNPVLLPKGLTANKDITGVNSFENPRNAYALNLDGASWAEVHDNASLDITDEVTLECWLYHIDTTTLEHIIGKRASSGSWLRIYSASTNTLRVERDGGASTSNVAITENAWNHILATIDSSDVVRFYINGTQQTSSISFTPWGMNNLAPASIGAWVKEDGTVSANSYATGQIALPRIYNRALTATEVARNYNADKSKFGL